MNARAPEFSRPLESRRVPKEGSIERIVATSEECLALAGRIGVHSVQALSAELRVRPWQGVGVKLEGSLVADLEQISVISGNAFRVRLRAPVERFFLPAGVAFGAEEADVDELVEGQVDLGEVVAETLILAVDPYPRLEGERFDLLQSASSEAANVASSPFASLKDK